MPALLQISDLSVHFRGIKALDGVSFEVNKGEICGLIGPNGSGKTTLFNCLSRLCQVAAGKIFFDGVDLLTVPAHRIAGLGLGRTFQNVALFRTLSVADNIKLGANCTTRSSYVSHALRLRPVRHEENALETNARELMKDVGLDDIGDRPVSELNFAAQKKVELARALASRPKLLLLDEPAGGLNHEEVAALGALIGRLQARLGLTVLVIEHHLNFLMSISHRVVALNFGRKIAEGAPDEVQRNPDVVQAYLGIG